jgi:hypothetical protein
MKKQTLFISLAVISVSLMSFADENRHRAQVTFRKLFLRN